MLSSRHSHPPARFKLPIAILVPTHNRLDLLERTVDSILASKPPTNRSVQLIVIENGGRFGVEKMLASKSGWLTPAYHYCAQANKSAALNSTIKGLDESLVIFLDDDVRIDEELLEQYSEAVGHQVSGKFYGGGMLIDYEDPPPQWLIEYLPPSARGWHPDAYSGVTKDLAFMGCNWAAFSSDIKNAGGFDAKVGPGGTSGGLGQEQAMQIALQRGGATPMYVRGAVVWHYVPRSRCSERWSLERAFKSSITSGLTTTDSAGTRSIGGVPLWMIRLLLSDTVGFLKSRFQADPSLRFTHKRALLVTYGRIKGLRSRHLKQPAGHN